MANVRLLRQSLEDYNARIAKIDAQYQANYGKYTDDVAAYNADVALHPHDPARSAAVGKQQYITGYGPDTTEWVGDEISGSMQTVRHPVYADRPTSLPTPVAPAQSVAPPAPSMTNSDYRALANPGTDPAGVVRDNNLGYTGNSEIAAMNDAPMRNSAFADPEDPKGLKDRGILARTLGGQL